MDRKGQLRRRSLAPWACGERTKTRLAWTETPRHAAHAGCRVLIGWTARGATVQRELPGFPPTWGTFTSRHVLVLGRTRMLAFGDRRAARPSLPGAGGAHDASSRHCAAFFTVLPAGQPSQLTPATPPQCLSNPAALREARLGRSPRISARRPRCRVSCDFLSISNPIVGFSP